MNRHLIFLFSALLLITISVTTESEAALLDLTNQASGFINSAFFTLSEQGGSGTGNIDTFVEIGGNTSITRAYNTTVNNVFQNGSSDQFNHSLFLSAVPIKTINNIAYREFLFDGNEEGSVSNRNVSIDEIQIFLSDTPDQSVTTMDGNGVLNLANSALIYRLGFDANNVQNWIKVDAVGSGVADMFAYIPNSLFNVTKPYLYLYSHFGANEAQGDGFEEWAVQSTGVIPEPATLSLLGLGLVGLLGLKKRKIA